MRQNLRAPAAVFATVASFAGLFAPQTARAVPLEVDDVWREVRAGTRVTSEHGETVFDGQYHTTAPEKFDRTVDVSHLDHLGVYHVWALAEHDTRIELIGNRGIRIVGELDVAAGFQEVGPRPENDELDTISSFAYTGVHLWVHTTLPFDYTIDASLDFAGHSSEISALFDTFGVDGPFIDGKLHDSGRMPAGTYPVYIDISLAPWTTNLGEQAATLHARFTIEAYVVPEPVTASMIMMATGGLTLPLRRRRMLPIGEATA